MARHRIARRVGSDPTLRPLDVAPARGSSESTGAAPEPGRAPIEPGTGTSAAPPAEPVRAPIDLEASRRSLEERQARWLRYRAEWERRRARSGGAPADRGEPAPAVSS